MKKFTFVLAVVIFSYFSFAAYAEWTEKAANIANSAAAINQAVNPTPWSHFLTLGLSGLAALFAGMGAHTSRKNHAKLSQAEEKKDAQIPLGFSKIPMAILGFLAIGFVSFLCAFTFHGQSVVNQPQIFLGVGNPNTNSLATNGPRGAIFFDLSIPSMWVKGATNPGAMFQVVYSRTGITNLDLYANSTNRAPIRIHGYGEDLPAIEVLSIDNVVVASVDTTGNLMAGGSTLGQLTMQGKVNLGGYALTNVSLVSSIDIVARDHVTTQFFHSTDEAQVDGNLTVDTTTYLQTLSFLDGDGASLGISGGVNAVGGYSGGNVSLSTNSVVDLTSGALYTESSAGVPTNAITPFRYLPVKIGGTNCSVLVFK